MHHTLLEVSSISKTFAGVHALRNVAFQLRPCEVHALVGENGAGKSTLTRIITGATVADSGSIEIQGRPVPYNTPRIARSLGVAAIYQHPALFPDLSVAENIAFALEGVSIWRRVNWKQRNQRAAELMSRAGISLDPARLVSSLSMPEQQLVEVAKAIGADAKILIMDEPTASLTGREVDKLFEIIGVLRGQGAGIIYISHRLDEISVIADRVTVLRDGETVGTRRRDEMDQASMIAMMVGRELAAVFPKREVEMGRVAMELRAVHNNSRGLRDISFSVRRGEILGIAGLVGSGRTELAETLFGLTPADSGAILMDDEPVRIESPARAIQLGIGYVPEDRRQHGVIPEMSIAANVTLANLKRVSRNGLIDGGWERDLAMGYLQRLNIKAPSVETETDALSGGNQQKVALARWLTTEPRVLILDEPTQGVDVGAKAEIHKLMVELAGRGLAILMISSELPEILGMSDRIAVMRQGSIGGILAREEATQQNILSLMIQ